MPRHLRALIARAGLLIAGLLLCCPAWAQEWARVSGLSVPDARGRWVPVEQTGEAVVVRGDVETPLSVDDPLEPGDRVVTASARVEIALGDGESLVVREGADATLGERSVIQELGEVYYRVRGIFSVQYGAVEATVEGTRFLVSGPSAPGDGAVDGAAPYPIEVQVAQGRVRVAQGEESLLVTRRRGVTATAEGLEGPYKWGTLGGQLQSTWLLGGPRYQLGTTLGGGWMGAAGAPRSRVYGRIRLAPGVYLDLDTAVSLRGDALRLPQAAGLSYQIPGPAGGSFGLGAQGAISLESGRRDCEGCWLALHAGGAASARYTLPLGRHVFLEGQAKVGYLGGLLVESGAGLGVGL